MLLPVIHPPVQLAVLENALGQRLGRAAVARDGRVPVVGGAVACLPHNQSDLSISAQPDLAEHKMDTPAVPPSAGPGGYRRLRPGPGKWKSAKPFVFFPLASFCFCSTRQTGDCGMAKREKKERNRENLSTCGVPRPKSRVGYPLAPPPPSMSLLFSISRCSTDRGKPASMRPCSQHANAQRAEQHTHRLCISRGRMHSDPLREWSGPRLTCTRARAKIRFGGPGALVSAGLANRRLARAFCDQPSPHPRGWTGGITKCRIGSSMARGGRCGVWYRAGRAHTLQIIEREKKEQSSIILVCIQPVRQSEMQCSPCACLVSHNRGTLV